MEEEGEVGETRAAPWRDENNNQTELQAEGGSWGTAADHGQRACTARCCDSSEGLRLGRGTCGPKHVWGKDLGRHRSLFESQLLCMELLKGLSGARAALGDVMFPCWLSRRGTRSPQ